VNPNNINSDILFLLTNQFEAASFMQNSHRISDDLIRYSILTIKVVNGKLRAYIGSDRLSDYISYTEIDIDLEYIDRLVALVYLDIHDNITKFILFADNKRIDHSFSYNFAAENINMKTLFYANPMLNNLVVNFSDLID